MSLKNRNNSNAVTTADRADSAIQSLRSVGVGAVSKANVGHMLSIESLSDHDFQHFEAGLKQVEQTIRDSFDVSVESFEDPTIACPQRRRSEAERLYNLGLESAAMVGLASADTKAYAAAAMNLDVTAPRNGRLVTPLADGPHGSMGYSTTISTESYDNTILDKFIKHSLAVNLYAARQDSFGEAFYPTVLISPEQGGADLTVRRHRVYNGYRHQVSGREADFGFRNLHSAIVDPTILADESTRLVPYRDPSISSPEFLLSEDEFGTKTVKVGDTDVPTAPYKFGVVVDMLGASAFAPLLGSGVLDHTDGIAGRASLTSVYLSGGDATKPVIGFNTKGLHRSSFVGAIEGRENQMTLNFQFDDIIIDQNTKAIDGSTVAALAGVGTNTVYARAMFTGYLDVQFGNMELNASKVTVTRVVDANGNEMNLTTGAGKTAKDAVEALSFTGCDVLAYRTNQNRRTPGKRLDVEVIRERYAVLVGPPISVQKPATVDAEAVEMEALISATRQRNSNNAITQLLNYADLLKSVVRGPTKGKVPNIAGMGVLLVKPFYEELVLDMKQSMNSIKSRERAEDVSATLVQALRDASYRAYLYSEIQAALDGQNPAGNEQPTLLIGTDPILVRHLMVQGDTRTFGTQFQNARVVVSQDERVRHHIFLTFTRDKNLDQLDALRFGSHLWMPELVSEIPVYRDGGTHKEAMVQTRNLHVNHLPVLVKIKVTNMPTALVDKTLQPAIATDISSSWLPGINFDTSK